MVDVIANSAPHKKSALRRLSICFALGALIPLSGCGSLELGGTTTKSVDRGLSTSAVKQAAPSTDTLSDEMTVRNAVTSADIQKIDGKSLAWANSSTGSAGVIETITENNSSGQLCRQFRTTRHSYDGIAKFYGKTCLVDNGNWQLMSFQPDQ